MPCGRAREIPLAAYGTPDSGIGGRKDVRTVKLAEEEGLRRPQADAGNRHECTRDLVIGESAHGFQVDEPRLLSAGKFQQAAGFGIRQPERPQPRRTQG
jgi:hypothetical protein